MKYAAIICEYNPLHNGHLHHIRRTRELTHCDGVICIMSGDFVQRGSPAILPTRARAEAALRHGADLVIRLPSVFSVASAQDFARGAVELIRRIPHVSYLSFGTEDDNLDALIAMADIMSAESDEWKDAFQTAMANGLSYPRAQAEAYRAISCKHTALLTKPNNILAIEYLKAIRSTATAIAPIAVKRIGNDYHNAALGTGYSSATAVRASIGQNSKLLSSAVPDEIHAALRLAIPEAELHERFYTLFRHKYLSEPLPPLTEGLDARIAKLLPMHAAYEPFMMALKTKRYTRLFLNRTLTQLLLGIDKDAVQRAYNAPVLQVLAVQDTFPLASLPSDCTFKNYDEFTRLTDAQQKTVNIDRHAELLHVLISQKAYRPSDFFRLIKLK